LREGVTMIFVRMCVLSSLLSACTVGSATFVADTEDVAFDPGGTVFAYVDATRSDFSTEADPRVVVAMLWTTFDPEGDLSDLSGDRLDAVVHETHQRDALSLVFPQQTKVDTGADFTVDNGLVASLQLTPERVDGSSTYADFRPYGSKRTVTVALTNVRFPNVDDDTGVIDGGVTIAFEAVTGTDPGNVRTGTVRGAFSAPIQNERSAEKNLALLDVKAELLLPLSDP
jgi:hypothetical protein